jgi:hypothetical protein
MSAEVQLVVRRRMHPKAFADAVQPNGGDMVLRA